MQIESLRLFCICYVIICGLITVKAVEPVTGAETKATIRMAHAETLWFLLDTVMSPFIEGDKNDQGCISCSGACPDEMLTVWRDGKRICVDPKLQNVSDSEEFSV